MSKHVAGWTVRSLRRTVGLSMVRPCLLQLPRNEQRKPHKSTRKVMNVTSIGALPRAPAPVAVGSTQRGLRGDKPRQATMRERLYFFAQNRCLPPAGGCRTGVVNVPLGGQSNRGRLWSLALRNSPSQPRRLARSVNAADGGAEIRSATHRGARQPRCHHDARRCCLIRIRCRRCAVAVRRSPRCDSFAHPHAAHFPQQASAVRRMTGQWRCTAGA